MRRLARAPIFLRGVRRTAFAALVVATLVLAASLMAASLAFAADDYPNRPITLIVPYPPGGPLDRVARVLAAAVKDSLGVVIVDNKPGAGANIAAEHVARAAPDGYTVLLSGNFTHAINPWLYKNLSWDPHRDFTPISEVALMSIIVCVTPQRQIRSLKELIAKADGDKREKALLRLQSTTGGGA